MKRESFLTKAVELFGVKRVFRKKYGVPSKNHQMLPVRGCECWRCNQKRCAVTNGFERAYKQPR